jgi:hypothetical protein
VKDECKGIGGNIFIYLREAFLNDVTEYGLHFYPLSLPTVFDRPATLASMMPSSGLPMGSSPMIQTGGPLHPSSPFLFPSSQTGGGMIRASLSCFRCTNTKH